MKQLMACLLLLGIAECSLDTDRSITNSDNQPEFAGRQANDTTTNCDSNSLHSQPADALAFFLHAIACSNKKEHLEVTENTCVNNALNAINGKAAYKKHCLECHGPEGKGGQDAYEIQHPPVKYSNWVLRNGRSTSVFPDSEMPAFNERDLSRAEATAIWQWLESLPRPTTGPTIYRDYCGNCHGKQARGGLTGKKVVGKEFNDIREKCRKGKGGMAYGNRKKYMPAWNSKQLGDKDLKLIAKYLKSLEK